MRVLITGGSGFIGRATARALSEDHLVTITSSGSTVEGVHKTLYLGLQGLDFDNLPQFDAVIHLLANNDTRCQDSAEMMQVNYSGPMRLFEALAANGCQKFVYASSTAVYGKAQPPYDETHTPTEPLNPYAESKKLFDDFAMNFAHKRSVRVIGLRYCNVYGPGEEHKGHRMSMVGQIIRKVAGGQSPVLFKWGGQRRDWVYINDVVEANLLALEDQRSGGDIYNIGSGRSHTFNEILEMVNGSSSRPTSAVYIDHPFPEAYQDWTECGIKKAESELGFSPQIDLQSGINRYRAFLSLWLS